MYMVVKVLNTRINFDYHQPTDSGYMMEVVYNLQ